MSTPRPEIACFMYHEVTDAPRSSGFQRPAARGYTLGREAFDRHLAGIAAGPLTPALVTRLDLSRPGRHLLLTFDDGGKSALHAAEALARHGWLGHFFIVTQRIGERTFVSADDIRAIRSAGHVVGSHSHSHPDIFPDLSPGRMEEEWRVSARILEDVMGEPCVAASVPGGDISQAVLDSAARTGFRFLFTSEPRLRPELVGGCWVLGRFCLKAGISPGRVRDLMAFRGWSRASIGRQIKVLARWGIGPLYRAYVRRATRPHLMGTAPAATAALADDGVDGP
ncbi:MAG TPA: polysaccharide deacetylase family protein [Gemmatimonadales bacterium]|nr:polysaccharide deacetylase family protein [Gemmatimonadales bacterium]